MTVIRTLGPTKIPGIPEVPRDIPVALQLYLQALGESVEIRLGRRGDSRDRAITLRELIKSGLAKELKANPFDPNSTGNSDNDGFADGDDEQDNTAIDAIPKPTGFTASGAYSTVNLYWDYPRYRHHHGTEVHHSTTAINIEDWGPATYLSTTDANVFLHAVGNATKAALQGNAWTATTNVSEDDYLHYSSRQYRVTSSGTETTGSDAPTHTSGSAANGDATLIFIARVSDLTRYYRIRHINSQNTLGSWSDVKTATVSPDIEHILTALTQSISASNLTAELANQIDGSGSAAAVGALETYTGYAANYSGDSLLTRITGGESHQTTIDEFTGRTGNLSTALSTRLVTAEGDIDDIENIVLDGSGNPLSFVQTTTFDVVSDEVFPDGTSNVSLFNGLMTSVYTPLAGSAWAATAPVAVDDEIYSDHRQYIVTVAGNTGATKPTHVTGSAANGTATLLFQTRADRLATAAVVTTLSNTVNHTEDGVLVTAGRVDDLEVSLSVDGNQTVTATAFTSLSTSVTTIDDTKTRTFAQATAPTADTTGDLWIDTDDGNKLYRWDGTNWIEIQDDDIGAAQVDATQAIADASAAQSAADGKVVTFYEDDPPTADGVGDLWIDTNAGNKLYRWDGTDWVEIQDDAIATAIGAASDAQDAADGKIVTFYADTAPTAEGEGDLWFDTDNDNKLYRWDIDVDPDAWVVVQDGSIALAQADATQAIADAETARALADGKIVTFLQDDIPDTGVGIGDLWIDTNDGNKLYRAAADDANEIKAGEWVLIDDDRIAQAILDAAEALERADEKIVSFYDATAPTAEGVGDLWVDTDDDNRLYRWNGSSWDSIRDTTIATAQGTAAQAILDAAAAELTADGKVTTYFQAGIPGTDVKEGDLWFDTDDGKQLYRAAADDADEIATGEWVAVDDDRIAQAILDAETAQAAADGKIVTFYTDTAPTAEGHGDLWFDTDDGNKLYRWNTNVDPDAWVEVRDTGIAANADSIVAQSHAITAIDNTVHDALQGTAWVASASLAGLAYVHFEERQYQSVSLHTTQATGPTHTSGTTDNLTYIERNKLAEATAVSSLNTEVYGQDPPTAAQLSGAGASKIDTLVATVDHEETGVVVTAGALETLDVQVQHSTTGLSATTARVSTLESSLTLQGVLWTAATAVAVNDELFFEGRQYRVTSAGDTGSTGPTHIVGDALNGDALLLALGSMSQMYATTQAVDAVETVLDIDSATNKIEAHTDSLTAINTQVFDGGNEQTGPRLADASYVDRISLDLYGVSDPTAANAMRVENLVTALYTPFTTGTAWSRSTTVNVDALINYGINQYKVTTGGALSADTPPRHTTGSETNGAAVLLHVATATELATAAEFNAVQLTVEDGDAGVAISASRISGLQGVVYADPDADPLVPRISATVFDQLVLDLDVNEATSFASKVEGLEAVVYEADGVTPIVTGAVFDQMVLDLDANEATSFASKVEGLEAVVYEADGVTPIVIGNVFDSMVVDLDPSTAGSFASKVEGLELEIFKGVVWVASTVVAVNDYLVFDNRQYQVTAVTGDAKTGSTGPTHTNNVGTNPSANGNATLLYVTERRVAVQTDMTAVENDVGDLEGRYTVKVDANGFVTGFGLASTANVDGTPFSEFYVNADRFAVIGGTNYSNQQWVTPTIIVPIGTIVAMGLGANTYRGYASALDVQGQLGWKVFQRTGNTSSGSITALGIITNIIDDSGILKIVLGDVTGTFTTSLSLWYDAFAVPFTINTTAYQVDGTWIEPGVYMDTAYIKHAAITAAQIGTVNADKITTGTLDVTGLTTVDSIQANRIMLDSVTLDTYLDGSVTRLRIPDAAITTAKIDDLAVQTLQIGPNAVTIPTAAYDANATAITAYSNSWTGSPVAVISVSWYSTGAPTFVHLYMDGEETTTNPIEVEIRFRLDGTVISTFAVNVMEGGNSIVDNMNFPYSRVLGAGGHTLTGSIATPIEHTLEVLAPVRQTGGGQSTASFTNKSLMIIEAKR